MILDMDVGVECKYSWRSCHVRLPKLFECEWPCSWRKQLHVATSGTLATHTRRAWGVRCAAHHI